MDPDHGKGLTFSEALEQLKEGRKLQRQAWSNKDQWVVYSAGEPQFLAGGILGHSEPRYVIFTPIASFATWTPSADDLNADDWAIYYLPGEYERLCQEETDAAIAEDPTLAAELEEGGKDLRTYSHEEVKMVVALRALEREDLADREGIRFRLIDQLLRPIFDHQRQLDLANHPLPLETVNPQVASMMNAFVGVITRLNDDLTQTKLVLDATNAKISDLERFEQAWRDRYPVPAALVSNDAILAHHRIRYFQDGWSDTGGFTQSTWRLISTLLEPILEEWRQSHDGTTGPYDLDRFKVILNGARIDGVDTIEHVEMELLPPVTDEQTGLLEKALDRVADPEATQQLVLPGGPGYRERQRLSDTFRLRGTFGSETPAEGPRQVRRAAPDLEPTQAVKYLLTLPGRDEVEVTKEEWVAAERAAGFRPKGEDVGQPATAGFSNSSIGSSGRIEHNPR